DVRSRATRDARFSSRRTTRELLFGVNTPAQRAAAEEAAQATRGAPREDTRPNGRASAEVAVARSLAAIRRVVRGGRSFARRGSRQRDRVRGGGDRVFVGG